MNKYTRCQQVLAELMINEEKLPNMKLSELYKILYTSSVPDDVIQMILTVRKRAMCKICKPCGRRTFFLKKLQIEKEHLKIEKQTLEAEINLYKTTTI